MVIVILHLLGCLNGHQWKLLELGENDLWMIAYAFILHFAPLLGLWQEIFAFAFAFAFVLII